MNERQEPDRLQYLVNVQQQHTNKCAETGQKAIADFVKVIHSKVLLLELFHVDQVHNSQCSVLVQCSVCSVHVVTILSVILGGSILASAPTKAECSFQ